MATSRQPVLTSAAAGTNRSGTTNDEHVAKQKTKSIIFRTGLLNNGPSHPDHLVLFLSGLAPCLFTSHSNDTQLFHALISCALGCFECSCAIDSGAHNALRDPLPIDANIFSYIVPFGRWHLALWALFELWCSYHGWWCNVGSATHS